MGKDCLQKGIKPPFLNGRGGLFLKGIPQNDVLVHPCPIFIKSGLLDSSQGADIMSCKKGAFVPNGCGVV